MSDTIQYNHLKQEYGDDQATSAPSSPQPSWAKTSLIATVFTSLIASVLLNGVLGVLYVRLQSQTQSDFGKHPVAEFLKYILSSKLTQDSAGLSRDRPIPWTHHTPYTGAEDNQTEADALWDKISVGVGTVALTNSYTRSKALPEAQTFPWDDDKGLYLLNGYHNLHCLVRCQKPLQL